MVCRLLLIAAALLVAVGAAPQIQTPYNRGIISTAVNPSRYAYTSPVVSSYPGAAYETYETGPAIYASAGPAIRPAVYASSAPAQIRPAVYASSAPAQIRPAVYATSAPAQIRPAVYASSAPRPVIPQGDNYDPNPQYSFSYSINDPETGDAKSHEESRNGDSVQGSYSLIESDGTRRIVEYTADAVSGFNAVVHREAGAAPPPPAPVRPYAAAQAPIVQRAPVPTPTVAYQPAPAIAYKSAPSLAYRTAPTVAYQTVPEVSYQSVPALGYNVAARQPLITSSATHPGSVQTSYTGPFGNYAY